MRTGTDGLLRQHNVGDHRPGCLQRHCALWGVPHRPGGLVLRGRASKDTHSSQPTFRPSTCESVCVCVCVCVFVCVGVAVGVDVVVDVGVDVVVDVGVGVGVGGWVGVYWLAIVCIFSVFWHIILYMNFFYKSCFYFTFSNKSVVIGFPS